MRSGNINFWALTAALGGFLFGFDTAVISGAEQSIQFQWELSDMMLGQMIAMALFGAIIGAVSGGLPAQNLSRKLTLIWIPGICLVSAVGSALAPDIWWLMFFRFIGGLSTGASSDVAPMYISEISPDGKRGRLTALSQFTT